MAKHPPTDKLGGKASNAGTKYMSESDYACQNKGTKLGGK